MSLGWLSPIVSLWVILLSSPLRSVSSSGQFLILLFLGTLPTLLHHPDLVPDPLIVGLHVDEPLADLLDIAEARLLELPLGAEILLFFLEAIDFRLDLGQPFEGVLFFLAGQHPLRQLELEQPAAG